MKGSKEIFIEKARKIYGNKYDYSKVEYVNANTKVCIVYPGHGEFWMTPSHHLGGREYPYTKDTTFLRERFIEKARKKYGDKYDYSKVEYKDNKTKVCIICPVHGEIWQTPSSHIEHGCGYCNGGVFKGNENFIKEAKIVHKDRYSYEKVNYVNAYTPVSIICSEHGEFSQTPQVHLRGCGCPHCAGQVRYTKETFVEKAREVHNNKYDYSKVEYVNNKTKVCIICPEHGEFWQTPDKHLRGQNCPKCGGLNKTTEEFIKEAKKIHGDKYDYSKVRYVSAGKKVCIICPEHGEFWQRPDSHLKGKGCIECSYVKTGKALSFSKADFIKVAREKHGDKYDYSKVEYVNMKTPVTIICPEHGEFQQTPESHILYSGCKKCFPHGISQPETDLFDFLKEYTEVERNVKGLIGLKEIDLYLPQYKIGIEYNGLLWHSEKFREDKTYHYNKMIECKKNGIKLIQIFEDEWLSNKDIVLDKLRHILSINKLPKIMARKCVVKEITYNISKDFLNKTHIQGGVKGTIYLGAYYNDELVGVMVFNREVKDSDNWELSRFSTNINYICQGVGGKILSYFVKNYHPKQIKSFADRRWTIDEENNFYTKNGFKFDSYVKPDYRYTTGTPKRLHKFNFRKQILHKKYGLPLTMTETEMTSQLGLYRVWDCGLIKYVLEVNH